MPPRWDAIAGPREAILLPRGLAVGEFRALWSAQVLSYTGDQFARAAIAILMHGRTLGVSHRTGACPHLSASDRGRPLSSGLADLFPRCRIMIVCDVSQVGTVGRWASTPRRSACRLSSSWPGPRARPTPEREGAIRPSL